MTEPAWVLPDVVGLVHQMLIAEHGGLPGVRDPDLLDSALNRPRQLYSFGERESITSLAACYCHGLARNHPFVDGNKRSALAVSAIFLEINGYSLDASEPEAAAMIESLSAGEITERELSNWFEKNSISGC
ncbi:MAG: type II toxin-antitoxin system death-on-curing family toxin [Gammaproteobacteria bacterium]|nr:MAG: type II toxin-antitoxin system death-on-curing family toxin [Gammaproteobacteria bacterium]PIE35420.1 MAG: type II toxin-antitoxin system death-on-curing family toxin [Gammaproteobacteria bacterium]